MHQHSNHCKVSQKIDWCKCRAVVPNAQRSLLRTGRAAALPLQPALLYDLHDELVPYEQAWEWQRRRVSELVAAAAGSPGAPADARDTLFLLQHPPVYTLGAGSSEEHLRFDPADPPHPLHRTERGGEVTYHGPGQLVLYPILHLGRHTRDLHWYLRALEEVALRALDAVSGLQGERLPGLTGAWVDGSKLAAIGVRARGWVTYHGLALNVSTHLGPFSAITPCGIGDRPVGSVRSALAAAAAATAAQQQQQQQALQRPPELWSRDYSSGELLAAAHDPLLLEYRYALLEAVAEVFGLQLQAASAGELAALRMMELQGDRDDGAAGASSDADSGVVLRATAGGL